LNLGFISVGPVYHTDNIKSFYWLVIALTVLFASPASSPASTAMAISPFGGFIQVLSSLAGVFVGIIFSRIAANSS